ncbi:hypothetical protein [Arthrobacter sp. H35-D1]|uniref:hypothetical protein n=1 Tax=Arthrobacter sp. H35-D1 TaxID=3046202 RepID=UPI0024BBA4C7|nr:hypothetical protein [Arthrobacter sp. H35-D1]MDJ0313612.1 hypothetical protein [Arthrobacter sp. H35-D1]
MSDHTEAPSSAAGIAAECKPPGRLKQLIDLLARIPLPAVGIMLICGAALSDVNNFMLRMLAAGDFQGLSQWAARLTLMQYNLLIPVALLALWARRRNAQGRLGAIGAALIALLPVLHVFLTICAVVWGLILGRGDMDDPFMYIEYLILLAYVGIIITSVAWMRDRSAARLIGPLILIGLALHFLIPWAFTVIYAVLAVTIIRTSLVRKGTAASSSDVS